jgi:hypothetical protein
MKKVADQISDVLYERLSSPFAHSFIIAWVFSNRALLLYLFTSGDVEFEKRLTKINSYINYLDGFIWPLLFTFISITVYVIGSYGAYVIWEAFLISKKAIRDKLNKFNHLTEEDANTLRDMNAELRKQKSEIQKDLENEISKLNDDIKYLKETHRSEIENLNTNSISEEQEVSVEEEEFEYEGGKAFSIDRAKWIDFKAETNEDIFELLSELEIAELLNIFLAIHKNEFFDKDILTINFAKELGFIDEYQHKNKTAYSINHEGDEFKNIAIKDGYF